ncbi:MAG: SirA family protein [Alphaproteobacteria bacterium]|nr:SirA family protein [Alphaproteobacteria bacterium]HCP00046.1 SirA family protein [Rhodospirillaceae bacterium]|tara:strand:+ start:129 stop:371 length:243 start_codon:yes stop_codon:yes gene_type:complete
MAPDEEQFLDATSLKCPLPVLKAKKTLKMMQEGKTLRVISTDPGSVRDFTHFCETTGNKLIEAVEGDGIFTFRICKGVGV